jgi:20S proteasome subunit beta 4
MDTAISLAGKDFVLSAADVTAARSIVVMKEDQDKIQELDRFRLLSAGGDLGDVAQFTEYIQRNVHLYELILFVESWRVPCASVPTKST